MWFLTLPLPHTCFRLGAREWLLVYTCVSTRKSRSSCINTPVYYPCIGVTFVWSGIPTAGCLYTYITLSNDCHNTRLDFKMMNWWCIQMPSGLESVSDVYLWSGSWWSVYLHASFHTKDSSLWHPSVSRYLWETRYFFTVFQFYIILY